MQRRRFNSPNTRSATTLCVLLAACHLTPFLPAKTLAQGGLVWQQTNGPVGGDIRALAVTPAGHLLAGTLNNRVFRSTDNGGTWTRLGSSPSGVRAFAIHPSGSFFAAASNVYRSDDNGDTWTKGDQSPGARCLAVNQEGHIFAGNFGRVFRSTDQGVTWTSSRNGLPQETILALAVSAAGHILAGTLSQGVFRSTVRGDPLLY